MATDGVGQLRDDRRHLGGVEAKLVTVLLRGQCPEQLDLAGRVNVEGALVEAIGDFDREQRIANAVYHATGVRARDLPITIEKLQPGLSAAR